MATSGVQLLGLWASPYSNRVQIAFHLKAIDYQFIAEDYFGSKSELLLKVNPVHKKIPVLIHEYKPICESLVILQYIDDAWTSNGPSILPSDPYDRAVARFWAAFIDETWFPCVREIFLADGDQDKKAAKEEEANQGLALLDDAFIKCSNGLKFFGGDKIGYIDIALGSLLSWIRLIEIMANISLIDESKTPNLFKWAQHFSSDDAVKDVLPETDRLMEFATLLLAKTKASGKN